MMPMTPASWDDKALELARFILALNPHDPKTINRAHVTIIDAMRFAAELVATGSTRQSDEDRLAWKCANEWRARVERAETAAGSGAQTGDYAMSTAADNRFYREKGNPDNLNQESAALMIEEILQALETASGRMVERIELVIDRVAHRFVSAGEPVYSKRIVVVLEQRVQTEWRLHEGA